MVGHSDGRMTIGGKEVERGRRTEEQGEDDIRLKEAKGIGGRLGRRVTAVGEVEKRTKGQDHDKEKTRRTRQHFEHNRTSGDMD